MASALKAIFTRLFAPLAAELARMPPQSFRFLMGGL